MDLLVYVLNHFDPFILEGGVMCYAPCWFEFPSQPRDRRMYTQVRGFVVPFERARDLQQ